MPAGRKSLRHFVKWWVSRVKRKLTFISGTNLVMDVFSPGPYVDNCCLFTVDFGQIMKSRCFLFIIEDLNNMQVIIPRQNVRTLLFRNNKTFLVLRLVSDGWWYFIGRSTSGAHVVGRIIIEDELTDTILERIKL